MRNYTTQMDAARKNIITPEMEKVAAKERMTPEEIRALVAEGKVAICANKNHKCLDPQGVGSMLKTKINVNLGVSKDKSNGSSKHGSRCHHGFIFPRKYRTVP